MSDGALVRQTLAGSPHAYEELVGRWAGRLLALCHARVHSSHIAEDMAQEAILRGYRSLASLADPEKFGAWLCGIATRACLDWLKARERKQVSFSTLASNGQLDGVLAREARPDTDDEEARLVMTEVANLPEPFRETLLLYYYEDVTYKDLADQLGVSAATINARLTRARQMLRERLEKHVRR